MKHEKHFVVYVYHEGLQLFRCEKNAYLANPHHRQLQLFTWRGAQRVFDNIHKSGRFTLRHSPDNPSETILGGVIDLTKIAERIGMPLNTPDTQEG